MDELNPGQKANLETKGGQMSSKNRYQAGAQLHIRAQLKLKNFLWRFILCEAVWSGAREADTAAERVMLAVHDYFVYSSKNVFEDDSFELFQI